MCDADRMSSAGIYISRVTRGRCEHARGRVSCCDELICTSSSIFLLLSRTSFRASEELQDTVLRVRYVQYERAVCCDDPLGQLVYARRGEGKKGRER